MLRGRGIRGGIGRLVRHQSSGKPQYVDARKFKGGDSGGGARALVLVAFAAASGYATTQYLDMSVFDGIRGKQEADMSMDSLAAPKATTGAPDKDAVQEVEETLATTTATATATVETAEAADCDDSSVDSAVAAHEASATTEEGQASDETQGVSVSVDEAATAEVFEKEEEEEQQQRTAPSMVETKKPFDVMDVTLPEVASERLVYELASSCSTASVDEIVMQIAGTHADVEAALLSNLADADAQSLRVRIAQMTAELLERSKWAGVRQSQAIRKLSADVSGRYAALMTQQRRELEAEAARLSVAVEQELLAKHSMELVRLRSEIEADTGRALAVQATALNTMALQARKQMQAEMAERFNNELSADVAEMRQLHTVEQLASLKAVYNALQDLRNTIAAAGPLGGVESGIAAAVTHRRMAAVLAAERVLAEGRPAAGELDALRLAFKGDALAETVLSTLSPSVVAGGRTATFTELKTAFHDVRGEAGKAALAPAEAPGPVGYVIGSVLYALTWARKGLVVGDEPEEVLARTAFHLDQGRLRDAVREVQRLDGPASDSTRHWLADAEARLVCDQALQALKARSAAV